jgi:hypothetical protein
MNGGATVSPLFVPNICFCGHDYSAHQVDRGGLTIGNCSMCIRQGGVLQQHFFTSDMEISPALMCPQVLATGCVSSGQFGTKFALNTIAATSKPASLIFFANPIAAGVLQGMTLTTVAANPANSITYLIDDVRGTQVTIHGPTFFNISLGQTCIFQGAQGSTMGGGLPPNGQRAG